MQGAPAARAGEGGVSLNCLHLTLVEYLQMQGEVCTRNATSSPCPRPPQGEVVTVAVQGYQLPTRLTV